jgi:hypothetical protein
MNILSISGSENINLNIKFENEGNDNNLTISRVIYENHLKFRPISASFNL